MKLFILILQASLLFAFSKHPSDEQMKMFDYLSKTPSLDRSVYDLYQESSAKYIWCDNKHLKENASDLIQAIEKSRYHGLNPKKYNYDKVKQELKKSSINKIELDVLLTELYIKLAKDLYYSKSKHRLLKKKIKIPFYSILSEAIKEQSIQTSLKNLAPKHRAYWRMYRYLKQHKLSKEKMIIVKKNMDRWRLYSNEEILDYIEVNLAGFWLDVVVDEKSLFDSKIVIGKLKTKTPLLESKIEKIVFNPYWFIPESIFNKNLLNRARKEPKLIESRGVLAFKKENLQNATPVPMDKIDFTQDVYDKYVFRENTSRKNPLGGIKIIFENAHHVYLHDTPHKEKFRYKKRAFSSGCIRVADINSLAHFLYNYHNKKSVSQHYINSLVNYRDSKTVKLKKKLHIYVTYQTAWVNEKGVLQFEEDIYGYDN